MKKFTYWLIAIVAVTTLSLNGCKKDEKEKPGRAMETLEVNFYKPAGTGEEKNVPQLTIKNGEMQFTAIGNNSNGVQEALSKIYISDTQTKTEWMVLLDNDSKPAFFYAINSATKEKLPELYWIQYKNASTNILRLYDYDWTNRLGTLQYEVEVSNNNVEIIYKNQVVRADRVNALSSSQLQKKGANSFPAPIPAFNIASIPADRTDKNTIRDNESPDEQFDKGIADFMNALKDLKSQGINAACKTNKLLNRPSTIICALSDQLDKLVNEKIFGDLAKASDADQEEIGSEYESDNIKFDIDFFNVADIVGNIARHINDIRSDLNASINLTDWFSDLATYTNTQTDDLNDLSDRNGVVHVALSWNTTSDIDLHVTDPFGEKIYFNHPTSNSEGYLDRDDVDGFGPENIYWMGNGPDGTYKVEIHYYNPYDGPATQFNVKVINGLGFSKIYQGTLSGQNEMQAVVVFTKTGTSITVQ